MLLTCALNDTARRPQAPANTRKRMYTHILSLPLSLPLSLSPSLPLSLPPSLPPSLPLSYLPPFLTPCLQSVLLSLRPFVPPSLPTYPLSLPTYLPPLPPSLPPPHPLSETCGTAHLVSPTFRPLNAVAEQQSALRLHLRASHSPPPAASPLDSVQRANQTYRELRQHRAGTRVRKMGRRS